MPKNEIGSGLAALLGTPAAITPAFTPPDVLPKAPDVHVETVQESAARKEGKLNAALVAMKEVLPEEPDFNTKLAALKEQLSAAQEEVRNAGLLVKEATAGLKRAEEKASQLERSIRFLDTRTDAEINQEYLAVQIQERFDKAVELQARLDAAKRVGLLSDQELSKLVPGMSPIDKAISERNQKARRAGYR